MKKIFILTLMVLIGATINCSKNDEGSSQQKDTFSEGNYTVKATLEGTGQLYGARIYIDTELGNEAKELSVFNNDHIKSMIGKTIWEGNYYLKKSIQCTVNARFTDDDSVLTVYLLKDGIEVVKTIEKGRGHDINGPLAHINLRF